MALKGHTDRALLALWRFFAFSQVLAAPAQKRSEKTNGEIAHPVTRTKCGVQARLLSEVESTFDWAWRRFGGRPWYLPRTCSTY